jgi:hypothetical protein
MFLALLLMNIFHPGMLLRGPGSEFMSRKEKKRVKKEKKAAKKAQKATSHHIVDNEVSESSV